MASERIHMEKHTYIPPVLKRIDLEDKEVVSMSDPCKDIQIPESLGGCVSDSAPQTGFLFGPGS